MVGSVISERRKRMRKTLTGIALVSALFALPAMAASNSANANAPGQDRVCLVTTGTANSWKDTDVVSTKLLPRKAAEAQAAKNPTMERVFDYSTDPLVVNGTYASAEQLCNEHFPN
jgi:ABC-type sugar transport system substrate-binding protein